MYEKRKKERKGAEKSEKWELTLTKKALKENIDEEE